MACCRGPAHFAAAQAVEELLRYLSVAKTFQRTALEDVELGGQTIKTGTTVILSYNTANRDPQRFPDPDTLDIQRKATSHLAFGHGIHQRLGQQLARIEMRLAFRVMIAKRNSWRVVVPSDLPTPSPRLA